MQAGARQPVELPPLDRQQVLLAGQRQHLLLRRRARLLLQEGDLQFPLRLLQLRSGERLLRGNRRDLRGATQKDRHVIAKPLVEFGFHPSRQLALRLPLRGREDHVPTGPKGRDLLKAHRLEVPPQLLVLDPAIAEIHPPQKGDIAVHS